MKMRAITVVALLGSLVVCSLSQNSPTGYATMNGGTTGEYYITTAVEIVKL